MITTIVNASTGSLRRLTLLLSDACAQKPLKVRVTLRALLGSPGPDDVLDTLLALPPRRRRLISVLRILVSKGVSIRLVLPSAEPSVADGDMLTILHELIPRLEVETPRLSGGKPRPTK